MFLLNIISYVLHDLIYCY